jgi:hypothetical protein
MEKRPALGKGLSALIPDLPAAGPARSPVELDVDWLEPSEFQPRLHMDERRSRGSRGSIAPMASSSRSSCARSAPRNRIIAGERQRQARAPVCSRSGRRQGRPDDHQISVGAHRNVSANLNPSKKPRPISGSRRVQPVAGGHRGACGQDRSSVATRSGCAACRSHNDVRNAVVGHARALLALPEPISAVSPAT